MRVPRSHLPHEPFFRQAFVATVKYSFVTWRATQHSVGILVEFSMAQFVRPDLRMIIMHGWRQLPKETWRNINIKYHFTSRQTGVSKFNP